MGAFNTVEATIACGYCHREQSQSVQFQYGTYQLEYKLGELLDWRSQLVVGRFWPGNVIVRGIADDCTVCHHYSLRNQEWWCDILVTRGHLISCATATWPVPYNDEGYVECDYPTSPEQAESEP